MTLQSIDTSYKPGEMIPSCEQELTLPKPFPPLLERDPQLHDPWILVCQENEEEQDVEVCPITLALMPALALPPSAPATQPPSTPAISDLTPLFNTMASSMMVLDLSGETHTIVTLNHPCFVDSPLFGTQIIIKEFSAAPKTFNVEILASPQAFATLQHSQQQLLARFEAGDFNFHIHRLETLIQREPTSLSVDPDQEQEHDQEQHSQEDYP